MNQIDKNGFLQLIGAEGREIFPSALIPPTNHSVVGEFKIKKKYLYRLSNETPLIKIHQNILNNFLNEIAVSDSAKAYRKNFSYLHFLEPHRHNFYFMRLDIRNFFHSISESLLINCFKDYFEDVYLDNTNKHKLIKSFINLISYRIPTNSENIVYRNKVILPIGFKTSPCISNIIFRKLDLLIQKYCSIHNITFTRYADDMLFSSPKNSQFIHSETFYAEIRYLLLIDGFKLNKRKTIKSSHTISLNGYIIENNESIDTPANLRISIKKTKKIEKLLHEIKIGKSPQEVLSKLYGFSISPRHFKFYPPKAEFVDKYCKDQLLNKILGYRSYLISVLNFNNNFECTNIEALEKYKKIISALNKQINIFEN